MLSSSRGTTLQAVLDRMADGSLTAHCAGLVSDRPDRGCVEKAKKAGLPVCILERKPEEDREQYDRRLDAAIRELFAPGDELRVLAALGWMFIFTPWFIRAWQGRIINVHPALLPRHGGKGMYGMRVHEAVLASGDAESGISIHLVDEGIDTGKILVQKKCSLEKGDTPENLKNRIQMLEKQWYPAVLEQIHRGEIALP